MSLRGLGPRAPRTAQSPMGPILLRAKYSDPDLILAASEGGNVVSLGSPETNALVPLPDGDRHHRRPPPPYGGTDHPGRLRHGEPGDHHRRPPPPDRGPLRERPPMVGMGEAWNLSWKIHIRCLDDGMRALNTSGSAATATNSTWRRWSAREAGTFRSPGSRTGCVVRAADAASWR